MAEQSPFIAIAGNPNSGKTTAFNKYTGSRQQVGNYPGITVEQKKGTAVIDGKDVTIVDLPGTYSLTAYSLEEVVARKVLTEEHPGAVLNVVNATVLERNLYLTVQMLEMGMPIVLAVNMMDEARSAGQIINLHHLSGLMQVPAIGTVARTGEGLEEALRLAIKVATNKDKVEPLVISYGSDIDEALLKMIPIIEENNLLTNLYPARWLALKLLEKDDEIIRQVKEISPDITNQLRDIVHACTRHLETTLNTYPEAVISDYRYGYISALLRQDVIIDTKDQLNRIAYSDKMDTVLTHRFFGPIIMLGVLYLMYFFTFIVGAYPEDWLGTVFETLSGIAEDTLTDGPLKSLIISGIIDGVGGVLGFVPLIMVMFLLIAILEDSGYMARVAYMVDRVFRYFGLHGASVMPFIISGGIAGGCAVPGVMAARTLRSPKERLATILTLPFMSCGAKLPVFLLFVGIFFSEHEATVMFLLTLTGWLAAMLTAKFLRSTIIKGEATPFVMELPPYRLPTISGVLIHTWERAWQYIKKAGTVILAISILLWVAMSYPTLPESEIVSYSQQREHIEATMQADAEETTKALEKLEAAASSATLRYSVAGTVGTFFEPVTKIAGFDWRTNIALLGGIAAKEVVISTLGTAYSLGAIDEEDPSNLAERIKQDSNWTKANAVALLLFTLLYSPCFVVLVVMKSETGKWRWSIFSLVFNLLLAFSVAVIANQIILAAS